MNNKNTILTIVFYDKNDYDGEGSRAVWEYGLGTSNTLYVPLSTEMTCNDKKILHDLNPFTKEVIAEEIGYHLMIELYNPTKIVFLDLAPRTIKDMARLVDTMHNLADAVIIDHHILDYDPNRFVNVEYYHDPKKSACLLTWEYCDLGEPTSSVKLINDRDIWANKMQPMTDYFNATFYMTNRIEKYGLVTQDENIEQWLAVGSIRTNVTNKKLIEEQIQRAEIKQLFGQKVIHIHDFMPEGILSNLGNILAKKHNCIFCFSYRSGDYYKYAMRSLNGESLKLIRDNELDGGGHPNSCGFYHPNFLIN